jgi:hypothetical protein
MEGSNQFQDPATLHPRSNRQEAGKEQEHFWKFWKRYKSRASSGNPTAIPWLAIP